LTKTFFYNFFFVEIQGVASRNPTMLRKSVILATIASASAFVAMPASLSPALSTARPLALRGGAAAAKMVKVFLKPFPKHIYCDMRYVGGILSFSQTGQQMHKSV
jgi:hypothetical protein